MMSNQKKRMILNMMWKYPCRMNKERRWGMSNSKRAMSRLRKNRLHRLQHRNLVFL